MALNFPFNTRCSSEQLKNVLLLFGFQDKCPIEFVLSRTFVLFQSKWKWAPALLICKKATWRNSKLVLRYYTGAAVTHSEECLHVVTALRNMSEGFTYWEKNDYGHCLFSEEICKALTCSKSRWAHYFIVLRQCTFLSLGLRRMYMQFLPVLRALCTAFTCFVKNVCSFYLFCKKCVQLLPVL